MPAPVLTRVLLALLAVGQLGLATAAGQTPRPMGIVDQLNVPRLGDVQLSPDGRDVLYTLGEADWKSGKRISHIWRAKVDGGQPVQLTSGPDGENAPRWSPDRKTHRVHLEARAATRWRRSTCCRSTAAKRAG